MTFAKIENTPGWNSYGPGETTIFSVTNKKIYNFLGETGLPMTTNFQAEGSNLGFGYLVPNTPPNCGLIFIVDGGKHNSMLAWSRSGMNCAQGFDIGKDVYGNNLVIGASDG